MCFSLLILRGNTVYRLLSRIIVSDFFVHFHSSSALFFAVGSNVDFNQLEQIVSAANYVDRLRSWSELESRAGVLTKVTCAGFVTTSAVPYTGFTQPDIPTAAPCTPDVDVVFVLDASSSIGRRAFRKAKQFINTVVTKFTVGPANAQVGINNLFITLVAILSNRSYRPPFVTHTHRRVDNYTLLSRPCVRIYVRSTATIE